MNSHTFRVLLLGALAGALAVAPAASAGGWFKEMDETKLVPLGDVLRDPHAYVDVPVRLEVHFNAVGNSYNPYYTRFNEDMYANFSAWPVNARLWEKRDYQRSFALFFASRHGKVWKEISKTARVESLELTAVVREVFKGQPWIEVTGFEVRGDGITERQVRDVIAGDAFHLVGRFAEAARKYERAMDSDLPAFAKAEILRKLGDAQYGAGKYRAALDAYRSALRHAPDSAVLKQGEEASRQAIEADRAKSRGREAAVVTVVPAGREQEVFEGVGNDVDAMIAVFEDSAEVAADVARDRQALVDRVTGGSAAAVEGEETAPAAEAAAPEAAPAEEAPAGGAEPAPAAEEPAPTPAAEEAGCGSADEQLEPWSDEAEETGEESGGVEGCAPVVEDGCAEASPSCGAGEVAEVEVEDGGGQEEAPAQEQAGCEPALEEPALEVEVVEAEEAADPTPAAEPAAAPADPRFVTVAGQEMRLPRLPFFGCDSVTLEQLRAIVEEVLANPES